MCPYSIMKEKKISFTMTMPLKPEQGETKLSMYGNGEAKL